MVIRSAILALLPILLSACGQPAASETSPDQIESEILARFDSLRKSAQSLDHPAYLAHFDRENFSLLRADGTIEEAFGPFEEEYTSAMAGVSTYRSLEFGKVVVRILDEDTATLANEYSAELILADGSVVEAAGGGLQVWQKRDGTWRLASVASSNRAVREDD